ncbi:MAG: methyltransferase [Silicimonas sp.]|nr:methyltransferase [Silicimonas sp.]
MDKNPTDQLWTRHSLEETREIYRNWASDYDRDVGEWGYATPPRLALALRLSGANVEKGVLDFGCGTGLSGMALAAVGFQVIDGTDITPEMLAQAEARGCYRQVWRGEPGSLGHIGAGDYPAIAACGVVSLGAAPPETLEMLVEAMAPGNLLGFSYNDATLADRGYTDALDRVCLRPDMELVFEEHGPHLPAKEIGSTIYVLKRT